MTGSIAPRILLADDGGPGARHAEEWAVWLSRHLDAQVHVVVAGASGSEPGALDEATFRNVVSDPHAVAQAVLSRLKGHGVDAVAHVLEGAPGPGVVDLDATLRPSILLMGTHGSGALQFRGSGTLMDQVKNHVGASILVARTGRPGTVAAAVDGSAQSIQAALLGEAWARAMKVPFTVLLAQGVPLPRDLAGRPTLNIVEPAAEALTGWTLQHADALIVLGSRGLGGSRELHLGSVSDRVCLTARCSVLVLRPGREGPADGGKRGRRKGMPAHALTGAASLPRGGPAVATGGPSSPAGAAIRIEGLRKRFGNFEALRGFDLAIPAGEIYGLIGPNGAGKTTAIRIMAGLLRPTSGNVRVLGQDAGDHALRRQVGYMPQETALYNDLTVQENLDHFGRLFGMSRTGRQERIDELLDFVGLEERRRSLVGELSGGMRHRTSLAAALMPRPRLLILDEPTVGVDPELRQAFWERFAAMQREGTTILLTTHYMDEARRCSRVGFLHEGRLAAEGTPQEILEATATDNLEDAFLATIRRAGGGP